MTFGTRMTRFGVIVLMFAAMASISCRRQVAATPPPPPPVPAPPPPPEPSITVTAQPGTINRGEMVTLQWQATNAVTVNITPELGSVPTSGMRAVNPASSVTYTATATGPGGSATGVARITVNTPPPPPAAPAPPRTPDVSISELFQRNVQDILFDYDQAEIRADQMARLQGNATWLKANSNVRFTVQGHADERGSQEYNLGLGDRRANAVKEFLASQGVADSRINVVSFGEERPACQDQSEDCFQRNRRAAFVMNP